ncbi:MAG TPA: hypothetical protein VGV93_00545 [Acidimicrobiales bacterium]|nr:hypothetical protein [Acidimicrobiales bacterium]
MRNPEGPAGPEARAASRSTIVGVRRLIRAVGLAALVAACAGRGDDGADLARSVASTTGEGSSSSSSPSTAAAPATTAAPTLTSLLPVGDIVLGPLGLGVVDFGVEAATALAALEARLGPPVDDRPLGSCPSGEVDRVVQFAELSVLIDVAGGTERFVAWDLGEPSTGRPRLTTTEGIGIGTSVAELRSVYGDRLRLSGDDPFGPAFEVEVGPPARLGGSLTGTSDNAVVATLSGGTASCAP